MANVHPIVEFILIILLPPVAVYLHAGECNVHVVANIVLLLLVWVPAAIHAAWYCFCRD